MLLKELITELCAVSAPSGYEDAAAATIRELVSPFSDEIRTDVMGNLTAYKRCGHESAKLLMFCAHMDEVGLIVTGYDEGFLRFELVGGFDTRMLPAREIKLLTPEPIYGVIDVMPVHVLSADEQEMPTPADKLFIDVGLSDEETRRRVPLGTYGVFAGGVEALGDGILSGKAMDDRSCAAILIKTMEYLQSKQLSIDVCAMFSVQEELGTRGAQTGAFCAEPDYCVAVDVTFAHTPDSQKSKTFKFGGGPAIGKGPNMNRLLTGLLTEIADDKEIAYQIEVMSGYTGTDAWPIQISRGGVATAVVSLPIKYMHSPVETCKLSDADAIVRLLSELAVRIGEGL